MTAANTVLIVDDAPENIDILNSLLQSKYRVKVTINSDQVMALAKAEPVPDIILLDVNMPGLSGYDVLSLLQQDEATKDIPVIFVTATNEPKAEEKGFKLGAVDYISKPFSPTIVLARIKNHLSLYNHHQELELQVKKQTQKIKDTRLDIINQLGKASEYRDNETGMHVIRMSQYSRMLAEYIGLSAKEVDLIHQASPLHDLGKIGIPDTILLKPGPLDKKEWEIMKRHTEFAADIVGETDCEILSLAKVIALNHHEKWDGSGYPKGLAGKDIPIAGRICAVADVFDALTSVRPYKKAWTNEKAHEYINSLSGKQFDPEIVDAFNIIYPQMLEIQARFKDEDEDEDEESLVLSN